MPTSCTMAASTPAAINAAQKLLRLGHFIGEDQRIEGDITLDAAAVEELHQLGQIGFGEILGAHPGVETLQAEIDGIGAIFDRGLDALPIARRGQQFRARQRGGKFVRGFLFLFGWLRCRSFEAAF